MTEQTSLRPEMKSRQHIAEETSSTLMDAKPNLYIEDKKGLLLKPIRAIIARIRRKDTPGNEDKVLADIAQGQVEEENGFQPSVSSAWIKQPEAIAKNSILPPVELLELADLKNKIPIPAFKLDNLTGKVVKIEQNSKDQLEAARKENQRRLEIYTKQQELEFEKDNLVQGPEKPPILPGEKFSPTGDLQRIRQIPKEQQRQALAEYKIKLAYQQKGLSKLRERLVQNVLFEANFPREALNKTVATYAERYGFDDIELLNIVNILDSYADKHAKVNSLRSQYPDNTTLAQAVLGIKPQGEVRVVMGPMSVTFILPDRTDFDQAYLAENKNATMEQSEEAKYNAEHSAGAILHYVKLNHELDNLIIISRYSDKDVLEHEGQHVINQLFLPKRNAEKASQLQIPFRERLQEAKTNREKESIVETNLRGLLDMKLINTQDEVIAYLRGGTTDKEIAKGLTDPYGIYSDNRGMGFMQEQFFAGANGLPISIVEKSVHKVLEEEYDTAVVEGVDAFRKLCDGGYTREQAFGLLAGKPLRQWGKLVRRQLVQTSQSDLSIEEKAA